MKDVVQPIAYDQYGREVTKYLPYADSLTTYGTYRANALTDQSAFYKNPNSGVTINYYANATTVPEASPLNRPVEQGFPGAAWQPGSGHTVTMGYNVNTLADSVRLWVINTGGGGASRGGNYYTAGTVYKSTSTDENGHAVIPIWREYAALTELCVLVPSF